MAYRGSMLAPLFGGFTPLYGLRREIDRLFDEASNTTPAARWAPAVDVREDDKALAIDVELPGIKPENVQIQVDNGILTVGGEKRAERSEDKEGKYHLVERTYGSFYRTFQLPQGIDESQIKAEFGNGLLTIRIPKAALPQPRKIEIAPKTEQEVKAQAVREPVSGRAGAKGAADDTEKRAAAGAQH